MITGIKVSRPSKEQLANDTADALGIPHATMSAGGTVVSTFLDEVHHALYGKPTGQADTYRKAEAVLTSLGLTYDPYWDTSEAADKGGGTVTARAYSRIRSAVTGTPRCFILNVTDAPAGSKWEVDHTESYRYNDTVTGRMPFNEAGPGSRVIYYSTSSSGANKMSFVGHAEVAYIGDGWAGPWVARLTGFTSFDSPVSVLGVDISGWNRQHAITEIDWATYEQIVSGGDGSPNEVAVSTSDDPGGDIVAERVAQDFPPTLGWATLFIPQDLPLGSLDLQPPAAPTYEETAGSSVLTGGPSMPSRSSSDRRRDRVAELRAVELTTGALQADGWTLTADRQKDGVGYDLEFSRDGQTLKVEVKGIQGPRLVFNVTPKEAWRAETDDAWVLVAVTQVLSPTDYAIHLLTRADIAAAKRVITGYRLTCQ